MPATNRIIRPFAAFLAIVLVLAIVAVGKVSTATPVASDLQPAFPLRAAFYYPWFPEAWKQHGIYPYTNYTPSLGFYDQSDQAVIRQQIAAMHYGGIDTGIASWWGQGSTADKRLPTLLASTAGDPFRWSIYYEQESLTDPSVSQITADLTYLRDRYGSDPSYLRINGRFVVFVYADSADSCSMVDRWTQANTVHAYLVLKVFGGYKNCAHQPDGWHQYGPATAADGQGKSSYTISPGFSKAGEPPRMARDLARWQENVRAMVASGAQFQLITTFNEWGEGTSVESAQEWASQSGYGAYLDVLHDNPALSASTPATTTASTAPPTTDGTPLTFAAAADARVVETSPTKNYGTATSLQVDGASDPDQESYLRFTVSGVSGAIQSAKVRVYVTTNGTSNGPAIYRTNDNWAESTLTWNTRPARSSGATDNKGRLGTNSWVEYDVTALISGNGVYSFVLAADSTDGVKFSSREGAAAPQLVLTLASNGNPAPTNTPVPTNTPKATSLPTNTPVPTNTPKATSLPTNTPVPTNTPPVVSGHTINTVFVILMENHNWADIKGNASAPYLNNTLLPISSYAQQYYNPPRQHPSEPNYLWLEAGTNFGITNDSNPSANHQSTPNHLVTLLKNAGISWKAYQEDISGTVCPLTSVARYAPKHNPMIFFDDVTDTNNPNSAYCIAHQRPYTELSGDLQNNTVARYNFITPNLCNDMHDCSVGTGDTWLAREVPKILSSQAYKNGGAIFITWDEGEGGDGPIGMIVVSPNAKGGGYSNTIRYTHSSALRTIQEIFGVTPLLGDAANATDLRDMFTTFP